MDDDVRTIVWKTYGQNDLNTWALLITVSMVIMILTCKRRLSVIPFLVVTHLIAFKVRVVIGDMDFTMLRLVVIAGLLRMAVRGEFQTLSKPNNLDKAFYLWMACGAVFHVILEGDMHTVVYRVGFCLDALGAYWIMRNGIRTVPDLARTMRYCVPLLIPVAIGMAIEWNTGKNIFHAIGAQEFTWVKDGKIRPAGTFGHPILAGSYAAGMASIYFGLVLMNRNRAALPAMGLLTAIVMVFLSASSGPVASLAVAIMCWCLIPFRRNLKQIRIAAVVIITLIHFGREKPVWHLIGRLSELMGGTGYHRYRLIDAAVEHFSDWFLFGTKNTANWGYGLQDITNFYLSNGVKGGIWTVLALLATLTYAFMAIGQKMKANKLVSPGRLRSRALKEQYFLWGLGTCLATHCVSFISVSYFGQMRVILFAFFGMLAFLGDPLPELAKARSQKRARPRKAPTSEADVVSEPSPDESPAAVSAILTRPMKPSAE